jgi:hypothetical protein
MEAFRECGAPAFVIALLAGLGVLLGLLAFAIAFARPKVGLIIGSVALVVAFSTPIVGVVGTAMGRAKVEQALQGGSIDPAVKERIRQQGQLEAAQCTRLGSFGAALPLLLSVGAMLFSFVRRQTEQPRDAENP